LGKKRGKNKRERGSGGASKKWGYFEGKKWGVTKPELRWGGQGGTSRKREKEIPEDFGRAENMEQDVDDHREGRVDKQDVGLSEER